MATTETATAAPAKKARKAQGPRTQKPVFGIIKLTDAQGNVVNISKQSGMTVEVQAIKDPTALVQYFTGGGDINAAVVEFHLPVEAKTNPAASVA